MHNSFLQKVVLTIVLSLFTAGLIKAYKVFVLGADEKLGTREKVRYKYKD